MSRVKSLPITGSMEQQSTSPPPSTKPAAQSDIDQAVAEALANARLDVQSLTEMTTHAAPAAPSADDFAALQQQIEALLAGGTADPEPSTLSAPAASVSPEVLTQEEAFEQAPIDPLLLEIDAAIADDADSLLKSADGDIDRALRSVFDERVLSGQEDAVNRALIAAFGTSRVAKPSFAAPGMSNPLPPFAGIAREIPGDLARTELDAAAAPVVKVVTPPAAAAESAIPLASAAPTAQVVEVSTVPAAPTTPVAVAATAQPVADAATATSTVASTVASAVSPELIPVELANAAPRVLLFTRVLPLLMGVLMRAVAMPLRALAAPMHLIPEAARPILSIAAVTMALWTPVAWWFAYAAAQRPIVAPITILAAEPVAAVEAPAAAEAAPASGSSGH